MAKFDKALKGASRHEAVDKRQYQRDVRSYAQRFSDSIRKPLNTCAATVFIYLSCIVLHAYWEAITLVGFLFLFLVTNGFKNEIISLPLFTPKGFGIKEDPNDPAPGRNKLNAPAGDVYLGNEIVPGKRGRQVWHKSKAFLQHVMFTGTTGSGKTEFLLAILLNFLGMGKGGAITDAKSDAKALHKFGAAVYAVGAEDDLLFCNYDPGDGTNVFSLDYQVTNHIALCYLGNAEDLASFQIALMSTGGGGSNNNFLQNAQLMVRSVTKALVHLRDHHGLILSWQTFRKYYNLKYCLDLANDTERLPDSIRNSIIGFLAAVSVNDHTKSLEDQEKEASRQFGFVASYPASGLGSLIDTYGHIFGEKFSDIDFSDIVNNDRFALFGIPSLKFPKAELETLANMQFMVVKSAFAGSLSREMEGTTLAVQKAQPYKGGAPFFNVFEEFRYINAEGIEITATQGRSMGVSTTFSAQTPSGYMNSEDGMSMLNEISGSTLTKIIGKAEGFDKTEELIQAISSKQKIAQIEAKDYKGSAIQDYRETGRVVYNDVDRFNIEDLRRMIEGEFHVCYGDRYVHTRSMFYATGYDFIDSTEHETYDGTEEEFESEILQHRIQLNTLVPLEPVSIEEALNTTQGITKLRQSLQNGMKDREYDPSVSKAIEVINKTGFDQIASKLVELDRQTMAGNDSNDDSPAPKIVRNEVEINSNLTRKGFRKPVSEQENAEQLHQISPDGVFPASNLEVNFDDLIAKANEDDEVQAEVNQSLTNSALQDTQDMFHQDGAYSDEQLINTSIDDPADQKEITQEDSSENDYDEEFEEDEEDEEQEVDEIETETGSDEVDDTEEDEVDDGAHGADQRPAETQTQSVQDKSRDIFNTLFSSTSDTTRLKQQVSSKVNIPKVPEVRTDDNGQSSMFSSSLFDTSKAEGKYIALEAATKLANDLGLNTNEQGVRNAIDELIADYQAEADLSALSKQEIADEIRVRLDVLLNS